MNDVPSIWKAIDGEDAPAGNIRRRVAPDSAHDLFLVQARPSRTRSFLAQLNAEPGTLWKDLRSSRGLGVTVTPAEASATIELTELDTRFSTIFDALVADVLAGLARVETLPNHEQPLPLDYVAGKIMRWQACMKTGQDGLSDEKQAGLFAELETLIHLIGAGMSPAEAVESWTGPRAALQDFQHAGSSIEVKASRQSQPTAVTISSERQLDGSSMKRLFLMHFALEPRTDGAGVSLPETVRRARQAVGQDSHAGLALDDSLLDYGYLDVHAQRYDRVTYSVRSIDAFDVVEGFPRLVEADLPHGVGQLSYVLALSACDPYRLDPTDVWSYLGGTAK